MGLAEPVMLKSFKNNCPKYEYKQILKPLIDLSAVLSFYTKLNYNLYHDR